MSHINTWLGEFWVIIKVTETGCAVWEGQLVIIIVGTRYKNPSSDILLGILCQNSHLLPTSYHIITHKNDPSVTWDEVFWIFIKRKKSLWKEKFIIFSVISFSFFLLEKELNNLGKMNWLCHTVISILNYITFEAYGIIIFDSQKELNISNFLWSNLMIRAVSHWFFNIRNSALCNPYFFYQFW